jgi:predicted nucleic acid-binding protein
VLGRKFSRDKEELARAALFLSELAEHVSPRNRLSILGDEPDNRVLECAAEGGAELIVTGDKAMLRLGRFQGVEILSLRTFLSRLESLNRKTPFRWLSPAASPAARPPSRMFLRLTVSR